ncbi:MAG: thiamine-phosphate kinase [Candidatus Bathyarchaeia archaeon]|nr:thiamine-phosphate kinase [Candidatus Bathyarchaeota archaeon A05DMB-4]MDH7595660.1 thiamine-phosphate kinase [Candidatus Bathyarchaeota archaeon]
MGERKVIETIFHKLALPTMPIPFGDDVAGVDIGRGMVAVLKTDMFVGKTDMPPAMNFWQAARKAVVMNVSDFSVKGVKPTALLVSLGLPLNFSKADVEQLAEGLNAGAREYGAYVIGGDTNEASDLIISCSLFGIVKKRFLMLRDGAEAGDIVAVTGVFGRTSAGLKVLLEGLAVSSRIKRFLLEAVLLPKARLKEGLALAATGAVSASIDSSDGLAWSLYELKKASGTGFLIDNLPVAPEVLEFAKLNRVDPQPLALYGGEEYELVVTIKPKLWNKAVAAVKRVGGSLIRIGKVTKDAEVALQVGGRTVPIEPKGWEHFKSKA